jgi:hypothetical protein
LNTVLSYFFYILSGYLSGKSLEVIRKTSGDYIRDLIKRKQKFMLNVACLVYYQSIALADGLEADPTKVTDDFDDSLPSWQEIMSRRGLHSDLAIACNIHEIMRVLLFRQTSEMKDIPDVLNLVIEERSPLRPILLIGIFCEGLVSFNMARRTNDGKWRCKGEAALARMKHWSQYSQWNFLNKALLLEAEKMYLLGDFEEASKTYQEAIVLSNKHKFIHEEAIACELKGHFCFQTHNHRDALGYFVHSVRCYEKWGAKAVAKRVSHFVQNNFDSSALFQWPTKYTMSFDFSSADRDGTGIKKRIGEHD